MASSQTLLWAAVVPILFLAIFSATFSEFLGSWLSVIPTVLPSLSPLSIFGAAPLVKLSQGLLSGTVLDDGFPVPVEAFLGVPYAQPALGDLRFRRAQALPPSNETFKASKYGPRCPGKQMLSGPPIPQSEDCMTVNIFRQRRDAAGQESELLPVAVYIHGGAFNRGSSQMHNTASMVAWSEEPFIGVSFNYRLGPLGFLPSTVTFEQGIVNLGLHDQVFLLQWVQDNIDKFGGDKTKVTIFGLSAGAHSIGHHVLNYKEGVSPLFHRAVIESGAPTSRAVHPYNAALHEQQFSEFVAAAGCSASPPETIVSCLRSQCEESIYNASIAVFDKYNPSLRWAFQPVIDGDLIQRRPIDAWLTGKWNRVPILTGHTTNEGTYYVPRQLSSPDQFTDFWHTLLPHYSSKDLATIDSLYPDPSIAGAQHDKYRETRNLTALGIGPQYKRVEAAYAHYAYACPVRQTADLASAGQSEPVWVYHWALNKTVVGGANHADNMEYEGFPKAIQDISESQKEVSGTYHAYITSFIVHGDPNTIKGRYAQRPEWKRYESRGEKVMTLGQGNDERAGGKGTGVPAQLLDSEWIKGECKFWWKKSYDTEE